VTGNTSVYDVLNWGLFYFNIWKQSRQNTPTGHKYSYVIT